MSHKWYAIQTYAGSEMAVKRGIENLVRDHGIEDQLKEVIVPTEDVIEIKNQIGSKHFSDLRSFT